MVAFNYCSLYSARVTPFVPTYHGEQAFGMKFKTTLALFDVRRSSGSGSLCSRLLIFMCPIFQQCKCSFDFVLVAVYHLSNLVVDRVSKFSRYAKKGAVLSKVRTTVTV